MNKNRLAFILSSFFGIIGIIGNVFCIAKSDDDLFSIIVLLMYFMIAVYLVYDYRTPHGNAFKYSLLVFSVLIVVPLITGREIDIVVKAGLCISSLSVSYFAGRLNRNDKNSKPIAIVFTGLFIAAMMNLATSSSFVETDGSINLLNIIEAFDLFNFLIIWSMFTIVYYARFNEHIEAGKEFDERRDD